MAKKVGRPTKYDPKMNKQVEKLCKLGATDVELANFFDVSEKTINVWKKHSAFIQSIKNGKEIADCNVANSLYKKATGFNPDTTAMIFWLKNRRSKQWRDKQEIDANVTGTISIVINKNLK